MKPRSLSFWLGAYLGLAGLLITLLLGAGMWQSLRHLVEAAETDKAQALVNQLAAVSVDAVLIRDYGIIERAVDELVHRRGMAYVEIRRADGIVLGQAGSASAANASFTATMLAAGEPLGQVVAQYDNSLMQAAAWRLALWAAVALVLFSLLGFWVLRRLLEARLVAPVRNLIASVAPGETLHAAPAGAPAEVHELAHALTDLETRVHTHITALEEANQAHNDALRRLCAEQRLATVGQMAGEVAHELNTPLANILGYAQLAQSQSTDPTVCESLDTIVTQARRAGQILGDMLTVARAPALTNQAVDLAELARAFSRLVAPLAQRQGVRLEITQGDKAPAWADASRVEQILFNLVTNATQAGAHRIELVPGAGVLDIVDDGPGVAPDMRSRLFEPFATSKPHGQGTGLGLAICRRLAEEMGGTLELAESAPCRTRFQLTLPTSP
ncbi:MAG: HAMP domain-containing sensor histidine kinase [Thiobacillus sp.]